MKKIYLTAILLLGLIVSGNAQHSYWSINWDIAKGMGDTGDFVGNTSFRGISADGRYFFSENASVGGFFGWNVLNDKLSDLPPYEFEGADGSIGHISGTQYRYLNIFPVLINAHYYVETGGDIKPYAGMGIGTVYTEQRVDVGLTSLYSDTWAFGVQPEVGVYIPFGYSGTGLNLAVRYLYGTSAGELNSLSTLTFAVGFGFMN